MVLRMLRKRLLLRSSEIRYIVSVGVDEIPEVEDPIGPAVSVFGGYGEEH